MTTKTAHPMFIAEFDRIGRNHHVPPLRGTTPVDDGDGMAGEIHRYASRYLSSREVDVEVYANGTGEITVGGFRSAGRFTWREGGTGDETP